MKTNPTSLKYIFDYYITLTWCTFHMRYTTNIPGIVSIYLIAKRIEGHRDNNNNQNTTIYNHNQSIHTTNRDNITPQLFYLLCNVHPVELCIPPQVFDKVHVHGQRKIIRNTLTIYDNENDNQKQITREPYRESRRNPCFLMNVITVLQTLA